MSSWNHELDGGGSMKSYDEAVAEIIGFLRSKSVCQSSINSHKDCYQQFKLYIYEHGRQWEPSAVSDWINELRKKEPYQLWTIWNLYMQQLEELQSTGTILDRHLYLNISAYERLGVKMKTDLDDYLVSCKDHYTTRSWTLARNKLAGMLLFFEDCGRISVSEISYQDIISYYSSEFCCSDKGRAMYLGHARRFFEFMSKNRKCPAGYALFLNDKYAPYVGCLEMFKESLIKRIKAFADKNNDFPADEFLEAIDGFIVSLKTHG